MNYILVLFVLLLAPITSCQKHMSGATMIQNVHTGNPYYSRTDTTTLQVSDAEWKKVLPADVYAVAREKDTERAFTGKYWDFTGVGTYYCAACGNPLFRSDAKFASTCGWPSFYETLRPTSVRYISDRSSGMIRTEVLCGRCAPDVRHISRTELQS